MFEKIMSLARHPVLANNGWHPYVDEAVPVDEVRAVATEAALATAVDTSPAVLVALWAHDQRLHPEHRAAIRRTA